MILLRNNLTPFLRQLIFWSECSFRIIVRESYSENCLDFIFAGPVCEKVNIVPDKNYMTPGIRKSMLDMLSRNSFQNICFLI